MKPKGFTIIELMIVVAIVGIALSVLYPYLVRHTPDRWTQDMLTVPPVPSVPTSVYREECISGYKFVISDGKASQIFNEAGKGVKC